jgi:NAD+ synthase
MPAFRAQCHRALEQIARATAETGLALILGAPWEEAGHIYNASLLIEAGAVTPIRTKPDLPNYGVFDDKRVFDAGPAPGPVPFRGFRLGLMICEDWWFPAVSETLSETGAEILIAINGSPFEAEKHQARLDLAVSRCVETGLGFVFVNQVGGQDELVFEGASFVMNADRSLAHVMPMFAEGLRITEWRRDGGVRRGAK